MPLDGMDIITINDATQLVRFLRCPVDGGELTYKEDFLLNERLNITYPVVDGIPDLRRPEDRDSN